MSPILVVARADPASSLAFTPTHNAFAASSSEAASLHGKKALTPIIAGSVCGSLMGLAWIIGFVVYFRKRYNRKQRNRLVAAGKATPRPKDLTEPEEKIVIPPDPAVLLGQRKPGEMAFPERERRHQHHYHRSQSQAETDGTHSTHPTHTTFAEDATTVNTDTEPTTPYTHGDVAVVLIEDDMTPLNKQDMTPIK